MEGGNELMLCPYCDGTATIDEEPFKGRYIFRWTDEQLAQQWNEWVKAEMEERYEQQ